MDFVSFTAEEVFSILDILKIISLICMIQDTIAWLKVSHPKEGCGGFDNKLVI